MTLYKIPKSGEHVCQFKVNQPVTYRVFDSWYGSQVPLVDTLSLTFNKLYEDEGYRMESRWKRLDGRDTLLVFQRVKEMTELLECIYERFDTNNPYMEQIAIAASIVKEVASPMNKIHTTISLVNKRCKIFSAYQRPFIYVSRLTNSGQYDILNNKEINKWQLYKH